MRRTLLLGTLLGFGCGDTPPPPAAPPELPLLAPPTNPTSTSPTAAKLTPSVLPGDLGGRTVGSALMPSVEQPALPAIATSPKPRESELDSGEIPVKSEPIAMPPSAMPPTKPARISPPKEHAPSDMGSRPTTMKIQTVIRPLTKAPSVICPGAGDVAPLVRMLPDKPPTDDPTAELSSALVIATKFPIPAEPLPFVRFTIPDPFENAGQLKGKLGKDTEFGLVPMVVNPEKK